MMCDNSSNLHSTDQHYCKVDDGRWDRAQAKAGIGVPLKCIVKSERFPQNCSGAKIKCKTLHCQAEANNRRPDVLALRGPLRSEQQYKTNIGANQREVDRFLWEHCKNFEEMTCVECGKVQQQQHYDRFLLRRRKVQQQQHYDRVCTPAGNWHTVGRPVKPSSK